MTELRLRRLALGWEPVQLVGRMKILAARDGITLPAVHLMVRLVFLWENQRAALPTYYATLINRTLGEPRRVSTHWNAVEYRLAQGIGGTR